MTSISRRTSAYLLAGALALAPLALATAGPSAAAPGDPVIQLTSQQLTEAGFPTTPNTTAWGNGTAALTSTTAAQWQDVVISGKAPAVAQPGQLLTMSRFMATSTTGDGTLKPLNITAVVQPDRSYVLHFQLGYPGTWGYVVGYSTGGTSPELVGFQFQFTTTGTGKGAPGGSSAAVELSGKKLTKAGFTKKPNVVGWGATATLSAHKAKAGTPVTIAGTAPKELPAGTVLTLERFVPTDKQGSGSFAPVGAVSTVVQSDGSFSLTFEVNEKGRYGYTLGAGQGQQWIGIEFQLKTT
jgi:hypothetical protein